MIELHASNSCSAYRCVPNDVITIPMKMGVPVVYVWVKQRDLGASIRVKAFHAVGLV